MRQLADSGLSPAYAGSFIVLMTNLGFRCVPRQALRSRTLRVLGHGQDQSADRALRSLITASAADSATLFWFTKSKPR